MIPNNFAAKFQEASTPPESSVLDIMFGYRYDSSESSDGDGEHQTSNPIKTLDFSESSLDSRNAAEQFENFSKSICEKRHETIETLLAVHNELDALPSNVSKFCNLKKLDISNNQLTALPEAILQLPLTTLLAKNNRLTHTGLPKSLEKLTNLKVCNFSGNNFSEFPQQLIDVRSMEYLYLGNNQIAELPKEIELMRK